MPQYLWQGSYTAESLAAQIKNPEDRLAKVAVQLESSVGAKLVGGGFCYGQYDIAVIIEAPDEESMAAVALTLAAGGAVRNGKTTPILTNASWVNALKKAGSISYTPAR